MGCFQSQSSGSISLLFLGTTFLICRVFILIVEYKILLKAIDDINYEKTWLQDMWPKLPMHIPSELPEMDSKFKIQSKQELNARWRKIVDQTRRPIGTRSEAKLRSISSITDQKRFSNISIQSISIHKNSNISTSSSKVSIGSKLSTDSNNSQSLFFYSAAAGSTQISTAKTKFQSCERNKPASSDIESLKLYYTQ